MKKIKVTFFTGLLLSIALFVQSCADNTDTTVCTIVVIGSSTAEGAGASVPDSAWVNRFEASLSDARFKVVNLARGGYTTYHLLPTGVTIPDSITVAIDEQRNITKALSYKPSAIIINLPSNDAAHRFPVEAQLANFQTIVNAGIEGGAVVWIATTQPRNFTDTSQLQIQFQVRDAILATYGASAIDFWSVIASPNGLIKPQYDSGDGIHLNDAGHALLFEEVRKKGIEAALCGL